QAIPPCTPQTVARHKNSLRTITHLGTRRAKNYSHDKCASPITGIVHFPPAEPAHLSRTHHASVCQLALDRNSAKRANLRTEIAVGAIPRNAGAWVLRSIAQLSSPRSGECR